MIYLKESDVVDYFSVHKVRKFNCQGAWKVIYKVFRFNRFPIEKGVRPSPSQKVRLLILIFDSVKEFLGEKYRQRVFFLEPV